MDLGIILRNYGVLLVCGLLVACLLFISNDHVKTFRDLNPTKDLEVRPPLTTPEHVTTLLAQNIQKQLECVADNVYYEARGEGHLGMVAVAQVVLNRVTDPRWPNSPCGVVYDGAKYSKDRAHLQKGKCQFSWVCQSSRPRPPDPVLYKEAWKAAHEVFVERKWTDRFAGLTFYHAEYVKPKWPYQFVKKVGRHLFYKG